MYFTVEIVYIASEQLSHQIQSKPEKTKHTEKLTKKMMTIWILLILSISIASSSAIPNFGGSGIGINYGQYGSNLGGTEIGINYGRYGSNLPPPESLPSIITSLSIKHLKTFDLDPRITSSFANTGISLSLCIPNDKIPLLSTNSTESETIIRNFILPYHKTTIIKSISVGNEVSLLPQFSTHLVSAMVNVHKAIKRYRLHKKIKVTTTHSLAILSRRFPPSTAIFHKSIGESVLKPLIRFLQRTNSPLMVNVYPYLAYKQSFPSIPLDFALFQHRRRYTDPYSGIAYTNLFDIMLDSVDSAVKSLGLPKIPVVVSEIGWPSSGDPGESAANLENARVFNQRLVEHLRTRGGGGWSKVPSVYIFALFDEDQKTGATVENTGDCFMVMDRGNMI